MTILVRAELATLPGAQDGFVTLAKALAAATDDEPGTLRYDWYVEADETRFVVIEEYVDSAAAFAHNAHCEELLGRVGEFAKMTLLQVHGEVSPELESWLASVPIARTFPPLV
jgi:quinol monooxygenase YgiN